MHRFVIAFTAVLMMSYALAADVTGTYRARIFGETIDLVLRPDGTGDAGGDAFRWRAEGNLVVITYVEDGDTETGRMAGSRLVIGDEVFERVGRTAGPAAAAPEKRNLPPAAGASARSPAPPRSGGLTQRIAELGIALTLPHGWTSGWESDASGARVYRIKAPGGGQGAIEINSYAASGPLAGLAATEPAEALARELQGGLDATMARVGARIAWRRVEGPEAVRIGAGNRGARLVFQGDFNDAQGRARTIEGYVGVVSTAERAYSASGFWDSASSNTFRPGADAIMGSLELFEAEADPALAARLAGCWSQTSGSTGGGGGSSAGSTWRLGADGTYAMASYVTVSVPGAGGSSRDEEHGRWKLSGRQVVLAPDGGERYALAAQFDRGVLVFGDRRYVPCR